METNVKIPLDELTTVRLVCKRKSCGGVVEMPTSRLQALIGPPLCPSCQQPFVVKQVGSVGGLQALGMSLQNLIGGLDFSVEFVVPMPNGG